MKEGYLQIKIAELNDKCKQLDQTISMEKSKIVLLQEKIGDYKGLLKKLNDIQEIKKQTVTYIKKENEMLIKKHAEDLSNKISKIIETSLNHKAQKIDEALDYLNKREEEIRRQAEVIAQQTKEINFLIGYNDLLMMKLVNKGILSDSDVNEMHRRASKKAKEE